MSLVLKDGSLQAVFGVVDPELVGCILLIKTSVQRLFKAFLIKIVDSLFKITAARSHTQVLNDVQFLDLEFILIGWWVLFVIVNIDFFRETDVAIISELPKHCGSLI